MKKVMIVNRLHTDNFGDRIIAKSMHGLFSDENIHVTHADFIFNPCVCVCVEDVCKN